MLRSTLTVAACSIIIIAAAQDPAAKKADAPAAVSLFDGKTLTGWKSTAYGGEGEVKVDDGALILNFGEPLTGVTFQEPKKLLRTNYELTLDAKRMDGSDFFCCLTFPVREKEHCSLVVGGWGGGLVGISCIDGFDASENDTTSYHEFKDNQWYKIKVQVTDAKLQCWIDKEKVVDCDISKRKLRTRSEVELAEPLGICSFRTKAAIKNIELKPLPPAK